MLTRPQIPRPGRLSDMMEEAPRRRRRRQEARTAFASKATVLLRRVLTSIGVAFGAACSTATEVENPCDAGVSAESAIVTIAWTNNTDSLRVLVEDTETIQAACSYVETGTGPSILSGQIVKGAGVDSRVPFHYVPTSVELVDATIELCDSALLRTEAEVDEYFLGSTGNVDSPTAPYCPWSAPPVRVESSA
jgi:hypothetical protein